MRRCNARATDKVDPIHPEQQKLLQCPGPTAPGWWSNASLWIEPPSRVAHKFDR